MSIVTDSIWVVASLKPATGVAYIAVSGVLVIAVALWLRLFYLSEWVWREARIETWFWNVIYGVALVLGGACLGVAGTLALRL